MNAMRFSGRANILLLQEALRVCGGSLYQGTPSGVPTVEAKLSGFSR
jgi:hypothetical protein